MSAWITVILVPFAIAVANIAGQFYFKWVPNVEDQKRHLKQAAFWAGDILMVAVQVAAIYFETQEKGQVTSGFVVRVALNVSWLVLLVVLIVFKRQMLGDLMGVLRSIAQGTDKNVSNFWHLLEASRNHVAVTKHVTQLLQVLAKDPNLSTETLQALKTVLDGQPEVLAAPPDAESKILP